MFESSQASQKAILATLDEHLRKLQAQTKFVEYAQRVWSTEAQPKIEKDLAAIVEFLRSTRHSDLKPHLTGPSTLQLYVGNRKFMLEFFLGDDYRVHSNAWQVNEVDDLQMSREDLVFAESTMEVDKVGTISIALATRRFLDSAFATLIDESLAERGEAI